MPLPKSCSVAARATEAYAEAWSVVLYECWGVKPPRDEPLPPLTQLLPFIRQLLTCCACAGLLEDAMVSVSCGHCYCAKCQTGTPLLKIQCRQCKERTGLAAENQIRIVVKCYRHMCHVLANYLATTPSAPLKSGEFFLAKGRETPEGFNPLTEILAEVLDNVKVSRNVLLVLPPPKYLNPKPPPDPPTPKKDNTSSGGSHKPSQSISEGASAEESDIVSQDDEESPAGFANTKPSPNATPSTSHTKTRTERRMGLKSSSERKRKSRALVHSPPSQKLQNLILSAMFHSDIEFVSARPKSAPRGEMKLFSYQKLLRLKQASLSIPETAADVEVEVECFDKSFVISTSDCIYKIKEDVPSSQLPKSNFPKLPSTYRSSQFKAMAPKEGFCSAVRSGLTPRAKFKLLRPKYKSPYLHTSHNVKQQKKPRPAPRITSEHKSPKIALTPRGPAALPEGTPVKKKKRSPMTPGHWRCRCGTNNPQTFDRICARGKCPCFVKNIPCINCLCRHCKNPYNKSPDL